MTYIIDKKKPENQVCVLPSDSDVPAQGQPLINVYNCKGCNKQVSNEDNLQTVMQRGQCNKCYSRIGGKYYPPTPFSKQVSLIPASSNYTSVSKRKNSNSATKGWSAKWPPATTLGACLNPYSNIIASEGNTKYTILKRKTKEQENVIKQINQTNNCNKGSDNRSAFIQFLKSCKSDKSIEGIKNFMVKYNIPQSDL